MGIIVLMIDSKQVTVNGMTSMLMQSPVIYQNMTYVGEDFIPSANSKTRPPVIRLGREVLSRFHAISAIHPGPAAAASQSPRCLWNAKTHWPARRGGCRKSRGWRKTGWGAGIESWNASAYR